MASVRGRSEPPSRRIPMIQGLLRSRSLHPACIVRKSIGRRLIALPGIVHVRLIPLPETLYRR